MTYHLQATNPYTFVRVRVIMRMTPNLQSHILNKIFSKSDDESLVKPNPPPQLKTGASKAAKSDDIILKDIPFTGNPPLEVLLLREPVDYFM